MAGIAAKQNESDDGFSASAIESASSLRKNDGFPPSGSLKTEDLIKYPELCARLKISRRVAERLVSKHIIQKLPGLHPATFYWPDVLAGLRSQKGYRKYAD